MSDIIWSKMDSDERKEYTRYLQIFGALSGLFKDIENGANANKPYLYYRNHEQLYSRAFNVDDLTRKDSAFDALAKIDGENIGIGLKTWFHARDTTFQKVAEFNKLAPTDIRPLVDNAAPDQVIAKVSQLRNERIWLDKRLYKTKEGSDIYHYITRDDNKMNIIETPYDLVQEDSLKLLASNGKTFSFTDGKRNYKYYTSKSVLMEEFNAGANEIITTVPINQLTDPFELLGSLNFSSLRHAKEIQSDIILPLYTYLGNKIMRNRRREVAQGGGINKWNRVSGVNRPWDVELRIPKWIHEEFNGWFFGHDFIQGTKEMQTQQAEYLKLNDERERIENEKSINYVPFTLLMPDGTQVKASVNGQNGKNLQSTNSKELGKWILKQVIGYPTSQMENKNNHAPVTLDRLKELDIDSLRLTVVDKVNKIIKITVAEFGAYEKFAERYGQNKELDIDDVPIDDTSI